MNVTEIEQMKDSIKRLETSIVHLNKWVEELAKEINIINEGGNI